MRISGDSTAILPSKITNLQDMPLSEVAALEAVTAGVLPASTDGRRVSVAAFNSSV